VDRIVYVSRVDVHDARAPGSPRRSRLELARPDGSYPGWTVLVGRSGAGKSTLLREIAGAADGAAGGVTEDAEGGPGYQVAWSSESAPLCLHLAADRPGPGSEPPPAPIAADPELRDGLDPVEDRRVAALALELRQALLGRGADRHDPAVVLIDDVDVRLHPSWQQRLGFWLTRRFPRVQFIVATQSPYVCQAADPGGLIRLAGPREDYAAEVVGEELYQRIAYGSADDAALSALFGLESAYSERAERVRAELVALERALVRGQAGAEEEERHRELSRLLTSSTATRAEEISARRRTRRYPQ
jgi:energy-coupling factor transporter ATP-binding protein EcfA2